MTPRSRRSDRRGSKGQRKDRRPAGGPSAGAAGRPGRWSWLATWWGRLVAVAAGVGAIVGAVTGIVNLWPEPDPVDRAVITTQVSGPERLSTFEPVVAVGARMSATAAPRPADPFGVGPGTPDRPAPAEPAVLRAPVEPAGSASPEMTAGPSSSSTPPPTASETTGSNGTSTAPSSTGSDTPAATTDPSASSTALSPDPPVPGTPPITKLSDSLRAQLDEDIRAQAVLERFVLPELAPPAPEPSPAPGDIPVLRSRAITIVVVDALDQEGNPVPPKEAAEQLAARLRTVRSIPTPEGQDPLGMGVTANLDIEGLRGRTLVLQWRLVAAGRTPVPDAWADWIPAAEVVATSERDTGFVTMWVPLPEDPGPYAAQIVLVQESDGAPLASETTDPFGG